MQSARRNSQPIKGDCEVCNAVAVEVWMEHGNILMCKDCREKEHAAVSQEKTATRMIEESRVIDSSIKLKTDVFLAHTVAAVELRGAIEADESIAADQKEYVYATECMTRFKHLQQVIFEKRQELNEQENGLRMWQVNVQTAAGKLRSDLRAQFKELDINYQPAPPTKKVHTQKPVKPGKRFDKAALFEAAKKYATCLRRRFSQSL